MGWGGGGGVGWGGGGGGGMRPLTHVTVAQYAWDMNADSLHLGVVAATPPPTTLPPTTLPPTTTAPATTSDTLGEAMGKSEMSMPVVTEVASIEVLFVLVVLLL